MMGFNFYYAMHVFLKDKNASYITRSKYLSSTCLHQNTIFFWVIQQVTWWRHHH